MVTEQLPARSATSAVAEPTPEPISGQVSEPAPEPSQPDEEEVVTPSKKAKKKGRKGKVEEETPTTPTTHVKRELEPIVEPAQAELATENLAPISEKQQAAEHVAEVPTEVVPETATTVTKEPSVPQSAQTEPTVEEPVPVEVKPFEEPSQPAPLEEEPTTPSKKTKKKKAKKGKSVDLGSTVDDATADKTEAATPVEASQPEATVDTNPGYSSKPLQQPEAEATLVVAEADQTLDVTPEVSVEPSQEATQPSLPVENVPQDVTREEPAIQTVGESALEAPSQEVTETIVDDQAPSTPKKSKKKKAKKGKSMDTEPSTPVTEEPSSQPEASAEPTPVEQPAAETEKSVQEKVIKAEPIMSPAELVALPETDDKDLDEPFASSAELVALPATDDKDLEEPVPAAEVEAVKEFTPAPAVSMPGAELVTLPATDDKDLEQPVPSVPAEELKVEPIVSPAELVALPETDDQDLEEQTFPVPVEIAPAVSVPEAELVALPDTDDNDLQEPLPSRQVETTKEEEVAKPKVSIQETNIATLATSIATQLEPSSDATATSAPVEQTTEQAPAESTPKKSKKKKGKKGKSIDITEPSTPVTEEPEPQFGNAPEPTQPIEAAVPSSQEPISTVTETQPSAEPVSTEVGVEEVVPQVQDKPSDGTPVPTSSERVAGDEGAEPSPKKAKEGKKATTTQDVELEEPSTAPRPGLVVEDTTGTAEPRPTTNVTSRDTSAKTVAVDLSLSAPTADDAPKSKPAADAATSVTPSGTTILDEKTAPESCSDLPTARELPLTANQPVEPISSEAPIKATAPTDVALPETVQQEVLAETEEPSTPSKKSKKKGKKGESLSELQNPVTETTTVVSEGAAQDNAQPAATTTTDESTTREVLPEPAIEVLPESSKDMVTEQTPTVIAKTAQSSEKAALPTETIPAVIETIPEQVSEQPTPTTPKKDKKTKKAKKAQLENETSEAPSTVVEEVAQPLEEPTTEAQKASEAQDVVVEQPAAGTQDVTEAVSPRSMPVDTVGQEVVPSIGFQAEDTTTLGPAEVAPVPEIQEEAVVTQPEQVSREPEQKQDVEESPKKSKKKSKKAKRASIAEESVTRPVTDTPVEEKELVLSEQPVPAVVDESTSASAAVTESTPTTALTEKSTSDLPPVTDLSPERDLVAEDAATVPLPETSVLEEEAPSSEQPAVVSAPADIPVAEVVTAEEPAVAITSTTTQDVPEEPTSPVSKKMKAKKAKRVSISEETTSIPSMPVEEKTEPIIEKQIVTADPISGELRRETPPTEEQVLPVTSVEESAPAASFAAEEANQPETTVEPASPVSKKKKAKKAKRGSIAESGPSTPLDTPTEEKKESLLDLVTPAKDEQPVIAPATEQQVSEIASAEPIATPSVAQEPKENDQSHPTTSDDQAAATAPISEQPFNTVTSKEATPATETTEQPPASSSIANEPSTPTKKDKKKAKKAKRGSVTEAELSVPSTPIEEVSKELIKETEVPSAVGLEPLASTLVPEIENRDVAAKPSDEPAVSALATEQIKTEPVKKDTAANPELEPAVEAITTETPAQSDTANTATSSTEIKQEDEQEPAEWANLSKSAKKKLKRAKRASIAEGEPSQPATTTEEVFKELITADQPVIPTVAEGSTAKPKSAEVKLPSAVASSEPESNLKLAEEQASPSTATKEPTSTSTSANAHKTTSTTSEEPPGDHKPPDKEEAAAADEPEPSSPVSKKKKAKKAKKQQQQEEEEAKKVESFLADETPEAANSDTQPSLSNPTLSETQLPFSEIPTSYPQPFTNDELVVNDYDDVMERGERGSVEERKMEGVEKAESVEEKKMESVEEKNMESVEEEEKKKKEVVVVVQEEQEEMAKDLGDAVEKQEKVIKDKVLEKPAENLKPTTEEKSLDVEQDVVPAELSDSRTDDVESDLKKEPASDVEELAPEASPANASISPIVEEPTSAVEVEPVVAPASPILPTVTEDEPAASVDVEEAQTMVPDLQEETKTVPEESVQTPATHPVNVVEDAQVDVSEPAKKEKKSKKDKRAYTAEAPAEDVSITESGKEDPTEDKSIDVAASSSTEPVIPPVEESIQDTTTSQTDVVAHPVAPEQSDKPKEDVAASDVAQPDGERVVTEVQQGEVATPVPEVAVETSTAEPALEQVDRTVDIPEKPQEPTFDKPSTFKNDDETKQQPDIPTAAEIIPGVQPAQLEETAPVQLEQAPVTLEPVTETSREAEQALPHPIIETSSGHQSTVSEEPFIAPAEEVLRPKTPICEPQVPSKVEQVISEQQEVAQPTLEIPSEPQPSNEELPRSTTPIPEPHAPIEIEKVTSEQLEVAQPASETHSEPQPSNEELPSSTPSKKEKKKKNKKARKQSVDATSAKDAVLEFQRDLAEEAIPFQAQSTVAETIAKSAPVQGDVDIPQQEDASDVKVVEVSQPEELQDLAKEEVVEHSKHEEPQPVSEAVVESKEVVPEVAQSEDQAVPEPSHETISNAVDEPLPTPDVEHEVPVPIEDATILSKKAKKKAKKTKAKASDAMMPVTEGVSEAQPEASREVGILEPSANPEASKDVPLPVAQEESVVEAVLSNNAEVSVDAPAVEQERLVDDRAVSTNIPEPALEPVVEQPSERVQIDNLPLEQPQEEVVAHESVFVQPIEEATNVEVPDLAPQQDVLASDERSFEQEQPTEPIIPATTDAEPTPEEPASPSMSKNKNKKKAKKSSAATPVVEEIPETDRDIVPTSVADIAPPTLDEQVPIVVPVVEHQPKVQEGAISSETPVTAEVPAQAPIEQSEPLLSERVSGPIQLEEMASPEEIKTETVEVAEPVLGRKLSKKEKRESRKQAAITSDEPVAESEPTAQSSIEQATTEPLPVAPVADTTSPEPAQEPAPVDLPTSQESTVEPEAACELPDRVVDESTTTVIEMEPQGVLSEDVTMPAQKDDEEAKEDKKVEKTSTSLDVADEPMTEASPEVEPAIEESQQPTHVQEQPSDIFDARPPATTIVEIETETTQPVQVEDRTLPSDAAEVVEQPSFPSPEAEVAILPERIAVDDTESRNRGTSELVVTERPVSPTPPVEHVAEQQAAPQEVQSKVLDDDEVATEPITQSKEAEETSVPHTEDGVEQEVSQEVVSESLPVDQAVDESVPASDPQVSDMVIENQPAVEVDSSLREPETDKKNLSVLDVPASTEVLVESKTVPVTTESISQDSSKQVGTQPSTTEPVAAREAISLEPEVEQPAQEMVDVPAAETTIQQVEQEVAKAEDSETPLSPSTSKKGKKKSKKGKKVVEEVQEEVAAPSEPLGEIKPTSPTLKSTPAIEQVGQVKHVEHEPVPELLNTPLEDVSRDLVNQPTETTFTRQEDDKTSQKDSLPATKLSPPLKTVQDEATSLRRRADDLDDDLDDERPPPEEAKKPAPILAGSIFDIVNKLTRKNDKNPKRISDSSLILTTPTATPKPVVETEEVVETPVPAATAVEEPIEVPPVEEQPELTDAPSRELSTKGEKAKMDEHAGMSSDPVVPVKESLEPAIEQPAEELPATTETSSRNVVPEHVLRSVTAKDIEAPTEPAATVETGSSTAVTEAIKEPIVEQLPTPSKKLSKKEKKKAKTASVVEDEFTVAAVAPESSMASPKDAEPEAAGPKAEAPPTPITPSTIDITKTVQESRDISLSQDSEPVVAPLLVHEESNKDEKEDVVANQTEPQRSDNIDTTENVLTEVQLAESSQPVEEKPVFTDNNHVKSTQRDVTVEAEPQTSIDLLKTIEPSTSETVPETKTAERKIKKENRKSKSAAEPSEEPIKVAPVAPVEKIEPTVPEPEVEISPEQPKSQERKLKEVEAVAPTDRSVEAAQDEQRITFPKVRAGNNVLSKPIDTSQLGIAPRTSTEALEQVPTPTLQKKPSKTHRLAAMFERSTSQDDSAAARNLRREASGSVKNLAERYENQSRSVTPSLLPSPEKRPASRMTSRSQLGPGTPERSDSKSPAREIDTKSPARAIDFAATVAASLQESGFDPGIVYNDRSFHRPSSSKGARDIAPDDDVFAAKERASRSRLGSLSRSSSASGSPRIRPVKPAEPDVLPPIGVAVATTDVASFDPLDVLNDPTFATRKSPPGVLEEADPDELAGSSSLRRTRNKKLRKPLPNMPVDPESTKVEEKELVSPRIRGKMAKKEKEQVSVQKGSVEYTATETPAVEALTEVPPAVETSVDSTTREIEPAQSKPIVAPINSENSPERPMATRYAAEKALQEEQERLRRKERKMKRERSKKADTEDGVQAVEDSPTLPVTFDQEPRSLTASEPNEYPFPLIVPRKEDVEALEVALAEARRKELEKERDMDSWAPKEKKEKRAGRVGRWRRLWIMGQPPLRQNPRTMSRTSEGFILCRLRKSSQTRSASILWSHRRSLALRLREQNRLHRSP
ncbi:hypothetical protein P3342_000738 [Pyrenophora teres f. teres]|nr:hypothetical protein P3342_000738 [Pyrenophora teres f. teres]